MSLKNLCQCMITPMAIFFLMFKCNCLYFSACPLPLVFSITKVPVCGLSTLGSPFPVFEFPKFLVVSLLQHVEVSQNDTKTIWCINCSCWYCTNLLMVQSASLSRSSMKKSHMLQMLIAFIHWKLIFSFEHFVYEYPICRKYIQLILHYSPLCFR